MPGWAPAHGEERRKDYSRAADRARALRANETPSEKRFWKLLRELNREGANFRRQANVGQRVFDFADLGRKVLIELDGSIHELPEVREADKEKQIAAVLRGYRVIRATNEELIVDPGAVIERIRSVIFAPSSQREEGRVEGRPTGFAVSRSELNSDGPLPLTPAPRGGGGDQ